ncbi:MAG: flavodoxin [Candidatus Bathyarchaeota archaeon]|nr:MAG: flavodoxin [Candidatus Bathyarchaeota archaeon]
MESIVVYFSRGGKTRKVAEAIAQELGCKSVDIKKETPEVSGVDMLLVGSGNYVGKTDKSLLTFLKTLQPSSNKKAAVFATSGGPNPNVISVLQRALEAKGYEVVSSFKCRGRFLFSNRGHPNEEDLKNAKVFARTLKKTTRA